MPVPTLVELHKKDRIHKDVPVMVSFVILVLLILDILFHIYFKIILALNCTFQDFFIFFFVWL